MSLITWQLQGGSRELTKGGDFSFSKVREDLTSNIKAHCKERRAQNMDDVDYKKPSDDAN